MLVQQGVYRIAIPIPDPLLTVNCYLLKDGDETYLVDTLWPIGNDTWDQLLGLFLAAGVEPRQLTGIIVTHAHHDHIGYLQPLQELTGAPVLLHEQEMAAYESMASDDAIWRQTMIAWFRNHGAPESVATEMVTSLTRRSVPPLRSPRFVSDGEIIPIGSMRWEVVWTPGHSPGHICLFERQRGLLITGDHVLPHETPNVSVNPRLPRNPLGNYVNSLRKLTNLPVQHGLPAHGDVFDDFQPVVHRLMNHHHLRLSDILTALRAGPAHAFDVACQIPWVFRSMKFMDLAPLHRYLALGETIAHLEKLEGRGEAQRTGADSPVTWRLTDG